MQGPGGRAVLGGRRYRRRRRLRYCFMPPPSRPWLAASRPTDAISYQEVSPGPPELLPLLSLWEYESAAEDGCSRDRQRTQ